MGVDRCPQLDTASGGGMKNILFLNHWLNNRKGIGWKGYPTLDLHGVRHRNVISEIIAFLDKHNGKDVLRITTGRSDRMIEIVKDTLSRFGYEVSEENAYNFGAYIIRRSGGAA